MLNSNVKIIKHKVGLLNLAEELGNVSKACKVMGLSRDTFYRYKSAVDEGGKDALFDQNRRKPNFKNRVDEAIESRVKEYAIAYPAHGQHRTSNELRKQGVFVSGNGVRSVWLRHQLANFKDRLKALEVKVAEEGIILTESQVAALERKKHDDEACGEIETAHPGYLGSQDTFYVSTLKGVGRVYQQTNGICEHFHKTILQEFYQVTLRKKIYETIDDLQNDLDEWLQYYNNERNHQGKMCCGRTPIQTLIDGKQLWKEKFFN
ncbi:MAG TPA: helix-turn-helix domain-containing protein [Legionella sp.]|nr:helix-turn-helix domain-containing protein [Legionella sp.]